MILQSYTEAIDIPVSVTHWSHSETRYHNHSFLEFVYVLSGCGKHIRNGKTEYLTAGDFFIIDYSTYHRYAADQDIEVINLMFTPQFIDSSLISCNSFMELLNNYLIKFSSSSLSTDPTEYTFKDSDDKIKDIFLELEQEYNKKKHGWHEIMRSSIIKLIVITLRQIDNLTSDEYSPVIQKIKNIVDTNYQSPISLSAICNDLHYSLSHISRKFKEETGLTFNSYLTKVRIQEACRLIANTNKKISDIVVLCGYNDIKHFQYTFKKITGKSPRDFKKQFK